MDLSQIKDWILAISASLTLISVAVGVWLSLREYRLKLRAERRLEKSSEIEAEVRLLTLFTQLMDIANGRSGYQVSEKAVEWILTHIKIDESKPLDVNALSRAVQELAVLTLPVGSAAQDASVAAIASLTQRHEVLRSVGLQALESLVNPITSKHARKYYDQVHQTLAEIESKQRKEV
jgi:hypothetical protein